MKISQLATSQNRRPIEFMCVSTFPALTLVLIAAMSSRSRFASARSSPASSGRDTVGLWRREPYSDVEEDSVRRRVVPDGRAPTYGVYRASVAERRSRGVSSSTSSRSPSPPRRRARSRSPLSSMDRHQREVSLSGPARENSELRSLNDPERFHSWRRGALILSRADVLAKLRSLLCARLEARETASRCRYSENAKTLTDTALRLSAEIANYDELLQSLNCRIRKMHNKDV